MSYLDNRYMQMQTRRRETPDRTNSFEFRGGEEDPLRRDLYQASRQGGHTPEVSNIVADHGVRHEKRLGVPYIEWDKVDKRGPMLSPAAARPGEQMREADRTGLRRTSSHEEAFLNQSRMQGALNASEMTQRLRDNAGTGLTYEEQYRRRMNQRGFEASMRDQDMQAERNLMPERMVDSQQQGQNMRSRIEQGGMTERTGMEQDGLNDRASRELALRGKLLDGAGFHRDEESGALVFTNPQGGSTGISREPEQRSPGSIQNREDGGVEVTQPDGSIQITYPPRGSGGDDSGLIDLFSRNDSEAAPLLREARTHIREMSGGDNRHGLLNRRKREESLRKVREKLLDSGYQFTPQEAIELLEPGTPFRARNGQMLEVPEPQ